MGFKKSTTIVGKIKNVICDGVNFFDAESGEFIDVMYLLHNIYGNDAFEISTRKSTDENLEEGDVQ